MIRRFCDVCGEELTVNNEPCAGDNGKRVVAEMRGKTGTLHVEVLTAINGVYNGGDVCKYCVIYAVSTCDDRPVAISG